MIKTFVAGIIIFLMLLALCVVLTSCNMKNITIIIGNVESVAIERRQ